MNTILHVHVCTQKSGLENELHHIREQLTLSAKQIELLKNERQMKEKEQLAAKQELQDRLEQLQRVNHSTSYMITHGQVYRSPSSKFIFCIYM